MIDDNQYVEVKWHPRNKERFENLGYAYTGIGTKAYVKLKDLSKGSKSFVEVVCDYCGEHFRQTYKDYLRYKGKDCCAKCAVLKRTETNMIKYGGKSPACSEEVREKMKQTSLERYGVDAPLLSEEVKEKIKQTILAKYGVDNPFSSEEVKEKIRQIFLAKYGGNSCQCDPEIRAKTLKTLIKNGNMRISKPEKEMVDKLKALYGESNCIEQYELDKISFDCLVEVCGIKIDVEFDGKYWHRDKHKDIKRDYFTTSKGYKVLRFVGEYKSPSEEQIKQGVDYLVNSEHHHLIIEV